MKVGHCLGDRACPLPPAEGSCYCRHHARMLSETDGKYFESTGCRASVETESVQTAHVRQHRQNAREQAALKRMKRGMVQ